MEVLFWFFLRGCLGGVPYMKLWLNIGCGNNIIKSDNNIKWVNMDKYPLNKDVVKYNVGDLIPFKNVDGILISHVLEHITRYEIYKFIYESKKVLKKNGVLKIVVPIGSHGYYHLQDIDIDFFESLYRGRGYSEKNIHGSNPYEDFLLKNNFLLKNRELRIKPYKKLRKLYKIFNKLIFDEMTIELIKKR